MAPKPTSDVKSWAPLSRFKIWIQFCAEGIVLDRFGEWIQVSLALTFTFWKIPGLFSRYQFSLELMVRTGLHNSIYIGGQDKWLFREEKTMAEGVLSGTECVIKALCISNKATIDRLIKHVRWANISERQILPCPVVWLQHGQMGPKNHNIKLSQW